MTSGSFFKRMPTKWFFKGMFAKIMEMAAGCTDCGECEERCPYKLPIREMMSEQVQWFEEQRRKHEESCDSS